MDGIVLGITMVITMEEIKAIGAFLFLAVVGYFSIRAKLKSFDMPAELDISKRIPNNKIILVGNLSFEELKSFAAAFCKQYNEDGLSVKMELVVTNDGRMAIVFPHDVDFDLFCFAVNYLRYPISDDDVNPEVLGWGNFFSNNIGQKRLTKGDDIMVFVADDDTQYDEVVLVYSNGKTMLHSFDGTSKKIETEVKYMAPPFDALQIKNWAKERIDIPTGV